MADRRHAARYLALLAHARVRLDPSVRAAVRDHVMEYASTHPALAPRGRPVPRWVWAAVLLSIAAAAGPMLLGHRSGPPVRGPRPGPAAPAHSSSGVDPAIRRALEPLALIGVPRLAPRGVHTTGLTVSARLLPHHTGYILDVGSISLIVQGHPSTAAASAALARYRTALEQALIETAAPATAVAPGTMGSWFSASAASGAAPPSLALVWLEGRMWVEVKGPATEHAGIVSAARVLAQQVRRAPLTHTGRAIISVTLWPTTPTHPEIRFGWTAAWTRAQTELVVTATGSARATGTSLSLAGLWAWVHSIGPLLAPSLASPKK